jgi:methyltransferase-like protein
LQHERHLKLANLRHERVNLDALGHHILPYLDGQHDRAALLDLLLRQIDDGMLSVRLEGESLQDQEKLREMLAGELDMMLGWFAKAALLVG